MQTKTVVTINSSGRQSASFIRVASAVGWNVRAQMRDRKGLVAEELSNLPNVTVLIGPLEDANLLKELFAGADLAFVNTTHWGDEVAVGKAVADAAKKAGVQHYVYSSMPDHSTYGRGWKGLPLWARKLAIESYAREIGLPATFVYCGIYHNNFTSLPYPLFRLELEAGGAGFVWRAPFHEDDRLPWLDSEHDVGPAVLQIFKQGVRRWGGHRIALAFSHLTPPQFCAAFSAGLGRPVRYERGPITVTVPIPAGYAEHLRVLEETLGAKRAPYFGPELENDDDDCTREALELWEGYRGVEEYAREVFPVEEAANGLTWMEEGDGGVSTASTPVREREREKEVGF